MKNLITFDKFAKVFTVVCLLVTLSWFVVGAVTDMGNSIAILPANEFNAMASLEADADYQHALKAQSR